VLPATGLTVVVAVGTPDEHETTIVTEFAVEAKTTWVVAAGPLVTLPTS
jgi:hypothetical protein